MSLSTNKVVSVSCLKTMSVVDKEERNMPQPKLSKLEFQVMELLWANKEASIRQIQEALAKNASTKRSHAYTTVQTVVYRLEEKGFVRRIWKIGNFDIFSAGFTRG